MPNPVDNKPDVLPKLDYSQCGFPIRPGGNVLALGAYFDESGTHNDRFLITAGYVAETERWAEFSIAWKNTLKKYGVVYFHMQEFENPKSKKYLHLSVDQKKELLVSLAVLIRKTAMFGLVSWIVPKEYKELTTPAFRSEHGSAYVACIRGLLILLYRMLPPSDRNIMDVFLESGHKNETQALQLLREWKQSTDPITPDMDWEFGRLASFENIVTGEADPLRETGLKIGLVGSGDKKNTPALQAADFLAYTAYAGLVVPPNTKRSFYLRILNTMNERITHGIFQNNRETILGIQQSCATAEVQTRKTRFMVHQLCREMSKYGFVVKRTPDGLDIDFSNASEDGMIKFGVNKVGCIHS